MNALLYAVSCSNQILSCTWQSFRFQSSFPLLCDNKEIKIKIVHERKISVPSWAENHFCRLFFLRFYDIICGTGNFEFFATIVRYIHTGIRGDGSSVRRSEALATPSRRAWFGPCQQVGGLHGGGVAARASAVLQQVVEATGKETENRRKMRTEVWNDRKPATNIIRQHCTWVVCTFSVSVVDWCDAMHYFIAFSDTYCQTFWLS